MRRPTRRRTPVAALLAIATLAAALAGCSEPQSTKAGAMPQVEASVHEAATDVNVISPVLVQATVGTLGNVRLVNDETGKEVKGVKDGNQWATTEPLDYNQTYTIRTSATKNNKRLNFQRSFRTVEPKNFTMPYLYPGEGSTVGIAQPVAVKFDEPIGNRQAAQDCIHIKTTPKVEGAFFWVSNSEVRWRGEHFWEPGTRIKVEVKCYGHDLGDGLYSEKNGTSSFTIGERVEGFANDKTHQLVIKKNGKKIKTIPGNRCSPHPQWHLLYW